MSVNLDAVADIGECEDWLRCPSCGGYDTTIRQTPRYIHFVCLDDDCDMHSAFELAHWS